MLPEKSGPGQYLGIVHEVHGFAERAAELSNLPGRQFGPGDAFRHIVGSAELTRRLGLLPAMAATEGNETRSWIYEQLRTLRGENVAPSLRADARAMDRANNAIGSRIGLRAATPDDVIAAAQAEIMRAFEVGQGTGGRATWMPPSRWLNPSAGAPEAGNWPPRNWPDMSADNGLARYPGHQAGSRYYRQPDQDGTGGGPVFVRPHQREGHPVSGYSRSAPAR